jgi:hypothetical protein
LSDSIVVVASASLSHPQRTAASPDAFGPVHRLKSQSFERAGL